MTAYTDSVTVLQMSGSLMAASMVEVVIGMLGIVGPLMRLVGPITVAPTITLIGLSLYKVPIQYSRPCPPMAAAYVTGDWGSVDWCVCVCV